MGEAVIEMQDIALVERTAATFDSPCKQGKQLPDEREPQQCVLLRAGGHMSVLDMEQGQLSAVTCNSCRTCIYTQHPLVTWLAS